MRKEVPFQLYVLFIILVLPSISISSSIWTDPNSFDVNIVEGCVETKILTLGNNGPDDLNFLIRSRQVYDGESDSENSMSAESATSSIPENYDFNAVENVPYKAGELIVRFGNKTTGQCINSSEKMQILNSLGGATIKHDFRIVPGLSVVKLPAGMTVESAIKQFNQSANILYAQPNYEVYALSTFPDDTRFNELWGMHNTGQSGGTIDADIDAPEAWDIMTDSSKIVVAVIDTGVDYTHPDLAANMWVNETEFNGTPGMDDDGNGYIDDIYGYDFYNNDGDPMDDHYHGTHCAGTVGATGNNGQGVAGVCWDVKIMAIKFLNSAGRGNTEDAIQSVEYSLLMNANLSSNSWGGGGYSQGLKDAIDAAGAAGMLFVAAAGNDSVNNDNNPHYPSSYNSDSLIAVMATDRYDNKSSFSNYGPTSVDLGAPGSEILSCKPGNLYQYLNGTSMATPHVAGACALLWSMNSSLSNTEVKNILLQTVDKTLSGLCVSEGRLNLYNAILETKAPWIEVEPEEGSISPGDSNDICILFDAVAMLPGSYKAEIVILSNDPCSPTIVPVTMTVSPDDLNVSPTDGFEAAGMEGGPFTPGCMTYTLKNNGTEPVNWTVTNTTDWLGATPSAGTLASTETINVNICIEPNANLLEPNIYSTTLIFTNTDSNSIKLRSATLTVKPPDYFTESFDGHNDLEGVIMTFSPNGSIAYYEACREKITAFPTDPTGGTDISLGDDDFAEVILNDNKNILFYGTNYDRFYIGSNGYITFGSGDTEYSASLENHFMLPRISGVFTDLSPLNSQSISYKQLDNRIAVTFENVPVFGDKTATNSFQTEMFFADDTIRISYLDINAYTFVTGLSEGKGLPPAFFLESYMTEYPICWPYGDISRDYTVNFTDFALFALHWLESECNVPYWCGKSDFDFSSTVDTNDIGIFADNWLITKDWWLQPVSHWKFDEGEGNTAYDSIGINHGTIYGAAWTTGQIDSALSFDGENDYVMVADNASQQITTNQITLSAWIKLAADVGNTQRRIICKQQNSNVAWGFQVFGAGYGGSSGNQLVFHDSSGTTFHSCISQTHLMTNQWYHVAVTDDAGKIRIYINGLPDEASDNGYGIPTQIAAPITIGKTNPDSRFLFDGVIDDVRFYDRALSAEEIWQLYYEGLGSKAYNPSPDDRATGIDPNVVLSWSPGKDAVSHDVYLGADYNDVNDADTSSPLYMGNFDVNSFDPCSLESETTYYWRIDELDSSNIYKGDIWSFTTFDVNLGLVGWWEFEEGNSSIAHDYSSGNSNDGILNGPPDWVTGKIGNYALNFDGDDYVEVADDESIGGGVTSSLTVSMWLKSNVDLTTGGDSYRAMEKADCYFFLQGNDGSIGSGGMNFLVKRNNSNYHADIGTSLNNNQWYHLVGTFNGTDIKVYLNGILKDTTNVGGPIDDDNGILRIGSDDLGFYFDGTIDDVRIYDRALAAEEIWQLYQQGLNP